MKADFRRLVLQMARTPAETARGCTTLHVSWPSQPTYLTPKCHYLFETSPISPPPHTQIHEKEQILGLFAEASTSLLFKTVVSFP